MSRIERRSLQFLARVPDRELLARVAQLVHGERRATSLLVAHLAELDHRRLYLDEGCSSLFTYCTQVLHLSEHAAYIRIEVARATHRFPRILDALERGEVHLAAVRLLAPHLTLENHRELLHAARHKSKREVEGMVAQLRPQPAVPTTIRKLARPQPKPGSSPKDAIQSGPRPAEVVVADATVEARRPSLHAAPAFAPGPDAEHAAETARAERADTPLAGRGRIVPLATDRYRVQFTASGALYEKLCRARDLLRHRIPDGDPVAIIDLALTSLLQQVERTKLAVTQHPKPGRSAAKRSRHVPAAVKRAVWRRDGGRCAFVGRRGRRCEERGFLEFHHVDPHGVGGEASLENIELRCRAHNRYEGEVYYGSFGPKARAARRATRSGNRPVVPIMAATRGRRRRPDRDGP